VTYRQNIEDKLWHHVALTVDLQIVNFFIDGNMVGSRTLATAQSVIDFDNGRLSAGAKYPGTEQFSGYLQDVRVYNRKFTDE
jgi:hypothetical protein